MRLRTTLVRSACIVLLLLLVFGNHIGADTIVPEIARYVPEAKAAEFGRITGAGMDWLWRIHGG